MNIITQEFEERVEGLEGHLLMANFHEPDYHCHLYTSDTDYLVCTFDEDLAGAIHDGLRHRVYVIGVAGIHPQTQSIATLHIKQMFILDEKETVTSKTLQDALEAYRAENDTAANFRRGWQEAQKGQTKPLSTLWTEVDGE